MTKITRALFLATGLTGLVLVAGFSVAPAQDKKGAKAAEKVGTVEIYKDKSGEFRFRVKDADGKVVAMPPKGYDTKEECQKVLDLIKVTLNTAKVTEVKDDKK